MFTLSFAAESHFLRVKLPRGVEVQIPKGWRVVGRDYNQLIETAADAAVELSDIDVGDAKSVNLIVSTSMPRTTYAALRIDSLIPPSATPQEVKRISKNELKELSLYMKLQLKKLLPYQGNQLLNFYGVHIGQISGYPALITTYRRSGPKGPVIVEINQIFTGNQELIVTLSYRESEKVIWLPVFKKIRNTIKVKQKTK
jgi:hypothetical protein